MSGALQVPTAGITGVATISISSPAAAVAFSLVCALLVGGAVMMTMRGRSAGTVRRIRAYVADAPDDDQRSLIERALGDKQARTIARLPIIERLRLELDVAGGKFTIEQVMIATLIATVLIGWLLALSTGSLLAGALAVFVPIVANVAVRLMADRARREFTDQLPDNLQVIASAMRAGQTFIGAVRVALDDAPEPSQRELRRAVLDEQLGVPLAEALGQVTDRMKSQDFQHVAIIAALQRETGGNTAEVIDLVAETVRERIAIRRMVRGLTAQGRLSGIILSGMPVFLLMFISLVNPKYVHPLFHSTPGLIALGAALGLVVSGGLVMRKIINIEV